MSTRAHKSWTEQELEYLQEHWGVCSIPTIAKHLGRSVSAVQQKAIKIGLGSFLLSSECVTLNQLLLAVKSHRNGYNYAKTSWGERRGLPVHTKKVNKCSFKVVYLDEFWDWAEKNRSFIDFSKMEPLALGEEPPWVAEQRRNDFQSNITLRKDPWTPEEDNHLKMLLSQHKYGYAELSKKLCRSAGAIQKRCCDLGIKERPVKASSHSKEAKWCDSDYQVLADGIRSGKSYVTIAEEIGKSEKAVRGKIYTVYLTENADKIRTMLGNGKWGDGAPVPNVKQALCLSQHRATVKKYMSLMVAALKYHMNELGYDPYFQRFMCMNWDDFEGCIAGCTDCDSCTEFRRIKPQYCARCGYTFYERLENKFCEKCRAIRKKNAQRKYARESHSFSAYEQEVNSNNGS